MTYELQFYRTRSKKPSQQFSWRLVAPNGKKVAGAGEGYARKIDCAAEADKVVNPNLDIETVYRW